MKAFGVAHKDVKIGDKVGYVSKFPGTRGWLGRAGYITVEEVKTYSNSSTAHVVGEFTETTRGACRHDWAKSTLGPDVIGAWDAENCLQEGRNHI